MTLPTFYYILSLISFISFFITVLIFFCFVISMYFTFCCTVMYCRQTFYLQEALVSTDSFPTISVRGSFLQGLFRGRMSACNPHSLSEAVSQPNSPNGTYKMWSGRTHNLEICKQVIGPQRKTLNRSHPQNLCMSMYGICDLFNLPIIRHFIGPRDSRLWEFYYG